MKITKCLAALLCLCLLMTGCLPHESPQPLEPEETPVAVPELPPPAEEREYEEVKIFYDGLLGGRAYLKDGLVFVSPELVAAHYGAELTTEISDTGFGISCPGLEMSGSIYQDYIKANGRYLYTPEGYLRIGGRIYLSADVIQRILGLNVTVYGEPVQLEISGERLSFIKGGDNYYDVHNDPQELYWLTQIIYSESRDEPLAGLIGVGNVVFNRVESELFPDTVFDVIFDREHAVQFDPVFTGGIHEQADERSYIAACLCLEGYNTVGQCLFFVNPDRGDETWVSQNREFVIRIGNHDFYA